DADNEYKFANGISSSVESFEYPCCFIGSSKILTRNIKTGVIAEIPASKVSSKIHQVFNTLTQKFIPVKLNIITGNATRFVKIRKNFFDQNKPNQDFYVTSGHK